MCNIISVHSTYKGKDVFQKLDEMSQQGLSDLTDVIKDEIKDYSVNSYKKFVLITVHSVGLPPERVKELSSVKLMLEDKVLAEFKLNTEETEDNLSDHIETE